MTDEKPKQEVESLPQNAVEEIDDELDALLDDAIKGFVAEAPKVSSSTSSSTTSNTNAGEVDGTKAKKAKAKQSGAKSRPSNKASAEFDFEAQFRKMLSSEAAELGDLLASEFEKAMTDQSAQEALFGGADGGVDAGLDSEESLTRKMEELTREMEKHLQQASVPPATPSASSSGQQQSGSASAGGADADPFSEDMLKQLLADGDGSFDEVLQDFINTILDKDILYPSIKELNEKYPPWLAENKGDLSEEEFTRFESQMKIISQICCEYEKQDSGSSVDDKADAKNGKTTEQIVTLMHQMRELGNPPEDLMASIQPEGGDAKMPGFPSLFPVDANASCPVM